MTDEDHDTYKSERVAWSNSADPSSVISIPRSESPRSLTPDTPPLVTGLGQMRIASFLMKRQVCASDGPCPPLRTSGKSAPDQTFLRIPFLIGDHDSQGIFCDSQFSTQSFIGPLFASTSSAIAPSSVLDKIALGVTKRRRSQPPRNADVIGGRVSHAGGLRPASRVIEKVGYTAKQN